MASNRSRNLQKGDKMKRLKKAIDEKSMKVLNFQQTEENELKYQILGSTGSFYDVIFNENNFSCSCPDHARSQSYCKHIYLVYIKIFHLIPDVEAVGNNLNTMQFRMMKGAHERFMELRKKKEEEQANTSSRDVLEGYRFNKEDECSICFDIFGEQKIFGCKHCKNCFHDVCMQAVFRVNSKCPLCRGNIHKDDMENKDDEEEDKEVNDLANRIKNTIFDM